MPESKRPPPKGYVTFKVNERPARVAMWLNQNFLLNDDEIAPDENGNLPDLKFLCLRNKPHEFYFKMESDTTIRIRTDDMDFGGELIQSLAESLGLEDLSSTCDFPDELSRVEQMLHKADELQSVRQRLSTEMADQSGLIRSLVVRAEDSRLMLDLKNMKRWYNQLYDINQDLVSGYKIRVNNNQELMDTLKDVNMIIQRAGRLRGNLENTEFSLFCYINEVFISAGKCKTKVITDCRNAIKTNNVNLLQKIIRNGEAS